MRFSPLAALLLAGCTAAGSTPKTAPPPPDRYHADTFGSLRDAATLVFVVHGDGGPAARSDELAFAQALTREIPRSAAVALLRPGHSDRLGHVAPGEAGTGAGDDFAPWQIQRIEEAILAYRKQAPGARVLVVGDGSGAAIAANLAGLRPELLDAMVLVGCPCALPEWRTHMAKRTGDAAWKAQVASLDPLKTAGGVAPSLRTAVLIGADDQVTPVKLSRAYAEAIALRGIATDYRIIPGRGHDLLGDPQVVAATAKLAAALQGKP